jgi:hypothetical protein
MDERAGAEVMLTDILVGDLVTPHGPTDPFEYDGTVLVLEDALVQVDLLGVLGEYPRDPSRTPLDAQQVAALLDASAPAPSAEDLLSSLDDDTLIPSGDRGLSNLMRFVAVHQPGLVDEGDLRRWGSSGSADRTAAEGPPVLVVAVIVMLVVLLAAGAWVAVRVVSGY